MSFVLLEKENGIGILTIHRLDALNALNSEVLLELNHLVDAVANDNEINVIIITGSGRSFVAGADIGEMANLNVAEGRAFGNLGQNLFRKIEKLEKPTIAAVNGFALGGGCELALCCDIRIASDKALFGQPEVGLGITPGFSGTQRLTATVGKAKAIELILTAQNINAEEALRIGLISYMVPGDELMIAAKNMAQKILKNAQQAVRWANSAIKRGIETDLDSGIAIEADLFAMCFSTEDQKEGMSAFMERRPAVFKGK